MGGKRGTRVPRAQGGSGGHRCKDDQAQRSAHPQDPQTWLPAHASPLAAFLAISSDHSPAPAKAQSHGVGWGEAQAASPGLPDSNSTPTAGAREG